MNNVIPRVLGSDGKHYPIFQLSAAERDVLVEVVHRLRHEQGFSINAIQEWLAEHGVPRGRGTIQRYMTERQCQDCPERDRLRAAVTAS
jgi:hypothetical protein